MTVVKSGGQTPVGGADGWARTLAEIPSRGAGRNERVMAAFIVQLSGARSMEVIFEKVANVIAKAMGRPLTFLLCCVLVLVWAGTGPLFHFSDTWQLVINTGTTIVTFLMVFLIQNSQNREGEALQAKLDELIRALDKAQDSFIGLEQRTEQEIVAMRQESEAKAGVETDGADMKPTRGGHPSRVAVV